jgi:hypothetical protein
VTKGVFHSVRNASLMLASIWEEGWVGDNVRGGAPPRSKV